MLGLMYIMLHWHKLNLVISRSSYLEFPISSSRAVIV